MPGGGIDWNFGRTVAVWDRDPCATDEKLRLVDKMVQRRDFNIRSL